MNKPSETDKSKLRLILGYWQVSVERNDQDSQDRVLSLLINAVDEMLAGKTFELTELEISQYLDASRLVFDMSEEICKLEQDATMETSTMRMKSALALCENTLKSIDARYGLDSKQDEHRGISTAGEQERSAQNADLPEHIAARHRLWADEYA